MVARPGGRGGPGDVPGANADADAGVGARREERERRVWRVEASAGRTARVGTFDLGADGPAPDGGPRWVLLRAHD